MARRLEAVALALVVFAIAPSVKGQRARRAAEDTLVTGLLASPPKALQKVLADAPKYRFQVLYGVVTEGATPRLDRHGYRVDAEYFFPASSMKIPITLAAYSRLGDLRKADRPNLGRDDRMRLAPFAGVSGSSAVVTSLESETWRAIIVSDNESANRLLSFTGHREAHETAWAFGLPSVRIRSRFAAGGPAEPVEDSPAITMTIAAGGALELPARHSDLALPPTKAERLEVGEAQVVNGKKVAGAVSFADKNAVRLTELQDALVHLLRPELAPSDHDATISKEDRAHLRETLGTLPSESGIAGFDRNVVADYRLRPFLRGLERVRGREALEVCSKIGQAFGFTIDNAYVVEKATGKSFFLTAVVYANPNETINDDVYGYDSVANPALADVAEIFARHAFGADPSR